MHFSLIGVIQETYAVLQQLLLAMCNSRKLCCLATALIDLFALTQLDMEVKRLKYQSEAVKPVEKLY